MSPSFQSLVLRKNISLLNGDAKANEVSVIHRVLLFTPSIRKCLDLSTIDAIIKECVSDKSPFKSELLAIIAKYTVGLSSPL